MTLPSCASRTAESALVSLGGVHGVAGFPDYLLVGMGGMGAAFCKADPDAHVQRDCGLLDDQRILKGVAQPPHQELGVGSVGALTHDADLGAAHAGPRGPGA